MGNSATIRLSTSSEGTFRETQEIAKHYSESLSILRSRLNSVAERSSQGTIANILAHVCLTMRRRIWDAWKIHMDGLTRAIRARGGIGTLAYPMPLLVTQYDLAEAIVFDSLPRFSLPASFTEPKTAYRQPPIRLQCLLLQLNHKPSHVAQIGKALQDLSGIADVVNLSSHSTQFWNNDIDGFSLLGPHIHYLLSMERLPADFESSSESGDLIAKEMVRAICLVVASRLKEMFTFFVDERVALQKRFADLVPLTRRLREPYLQVKMWALVTAASLQPRDSRGMYLDEVAEDVSTMESPADYAFIQEAKELIWIDCLESPAADELQQDLALRLNT